MQKKIKNYFQIIKEDARNYCFIKKIVIHGATFTPKITNIAIINVSIPAFILNSFVTVSLRMRPTINIAFRLVSFVVILFHKLSLFHQPHVIHIFYLFNKMEDLYFPINSLCPLQHSYPNWSVACEI